MSHGDAVIFAFAVSPTRPARKCSPEPSSEKSNNIAGFCLTEEQGSKDASVGTVG